MWSIHIWHEKCTRSDPRFKEFPGEEGTCPQNPPLDNLPIGHGVVKWNITTRPYQFNSMLHVWVKRTQSFAFYLLSVYIYPLTMDFILTRTHDEQVSKAKAANGVEVCLIPRPHPQQLHKQRKPWWGMQG